MQHDTDANGTDRPGDAPRTRHDDPIEGRLSIRKWYDLSAHLPGQLAGKAVNGLDTRRFIEAVLWIAATDSTWPQLPKSYGNFHAVYQRFARWTKLDVWDSVCTRLHGDPRRAALQRLVSQQRELQQRREASAVQAVRTSAAASDVPEERLQALEARVAHIEVLLRAFLGRNIPD